MEKSVEKRTSKSNRHFEIYLQYVKMYKVLKLKWTIQRGYTSEIQNIWSDMTRKLNDCGGPIRDVTHWKKVSDNLFSFYLIGIFEISLSKSKNLFILNFYVNEPN